MSDLIADSVILYSRLQQIFEETISGELESPRDKLHSIFLKLLHDKGKDHGLIKSNSIYSIKFYSLKNRIKDHQSFYEKLIRKDLGLELVKNFKLLNSEQDMLEKQKSEIIGEIKKFDDLIGFRIVTELKKDCDKVYELLRNNISYFNENQVVFKDIENQPQRMLNGLDIYRLKGLFQGLFGFELQIKSKIDEAWGDLDHTLFYKDYNTSPIKDTVQVTMNHVGELLDRIEHLLYDLRDSEGAYIDSAELLKFQLDLQEEVSPILKAKFGTPYPLKGISYYLKYFRDKSGVGKQKLKDINFDNLGWAINEEFFKSYQQIREKNYDLIVLESLIINWWNLAGKEVNADNYEKFLQEYLDLFSDLLSNELKKDPTEFNEIFVLLVKYDCSPELFFKMGSYSDLDKIHNRLDELSLEQEEVESNLPELKNSYSIIYFEGDFTRYLESFASEKNISDALIRIKESVSSQKSEIDLEINKLTLQLLEVIRNFQQ